MFCKKCGTQFSDASKFCPKCGQAVMHINPVQNQNQNQQQNMKQMFCKKCGSPMKGGIRFCPKCGTENVTSARQQWNHNNGNGFSGNDKPHKNIAKKIGIAVVSSVAVVAIAGTTTVNTVLAQPLPALALAYSNFQRDTADINSYHMVFSLDTYGESISFDGDYEVDYDEHEAYFLGTVEADYSEVECALCIEGYSGTAFYNGEVHDLPSDELQTFWDAIDSSRDLSSDGMDLEEMIESANIEDELNEYIRVNELNESYENVISKLSEKSVRKELEEALDIEKEGIIGEKTYSIEYDRKSLANTCQILFEVIEPELEDLLRVDLDGMDEGMDEVVDFIEDGGADDILEGCSLEWSIKNMRLTSLSFQMPQYDIAFDVAYSYEWFSLVEIDMSLTFESYEICLSMDEINEVGNVKNKIPDEVISALDSNTTVFC